MRPFGNCPFVRTKASSLLSLLAFALAPALCKTAAAAPVDVATWVSDQNTAGGPLTLTGTLGTNAITLQTVADPPNAGVAGFEDWSLSPGTDAYVTSQSPTSGNTWIAIAEGSTTTTETLTFSSALTNPILLLDYDDPTVTYNFGALTPTLLAGNNASLSSTVLTFPGATDSYGDAAAVQINGSFSTLSFTATDSDGRTDTQRFTVAIPVPEPASLATIAAPAAAALLRRRRHARGA